MTLLLIAYVVLAIVGIPTNVRYAKYLANHETLGSGLVLFAGLAFAVVALALYMTSIGHGIVALIILLPSIVTFIVGLTVGISENA